MNNTESKIYYKIHEMKSLLETLIENLEEEMNQTAEEGTPLYHAYKEIILYNKEYLRRVNTKIDGVKQFTLDL